MKFCRSCNAETDHNTSGGCKPCRYRRHRARHDARQLDASKRTLPCDRCGTAKRSIYGNCVECKRVYYLSRKGEIQEAQREYRRTYANAVMWRSARLRALRKGLEFTIEKDDIVVPDRCPLLDVPLVNGNGIKNRADSPSLDRIDPSKGYVKGNVWVISNRANQIKNDATAEELIRIGNLVMQRIANGS